MMNKNFVVSLKEMNDFFRIFLSETSSSFSFVCVYSDSSIRLWHFIEESVAIFLESIAHPMNQGSTLLDNAQISDANDFFRCVKVFDPNLLQDCSVSICVNDSDPSLKVVLSDVDKKSTIVSYDCTFLESNPEESQRFEKIYPVLNHQTEPYLQRGIIVDVDPNCWKRLISFFDGKLVTLSYSGSSNNQCLEINVDNCQLKLESHSMFPNQKIPPISYDSSLFLKTLAKDKDDSDSISITKLMFCYDQPLMIQNVSKTSQTSFLIAHVSN